MMYSDVVRMSGVTRGEHLWERVSADVGDARTLETLETLWTLTTGHWTPSPHQTRPG